LGQRNRLDYRSSRLQYARDGIVAPIQLVVTVLPHHRHLLPFHLVLFSILPSVYCKVRTLSSRTTLVEMRGFEPLTPSVQGRCSPN
jgi:hypothetical protein